MAASEKREYKSEAIAKRQLVQWQKKGCRVFAYRCNIPAIALQQHRSANHHNILYRNALAMQV